MTDRIFQLWAYLSATPLMGLSLTLLVYLAALVLYRRCGGHPLANPVLIAVTLLCALLWLAGVPYSRYFEGAQFVHFLLGPATVALALPLYAQFNRVQSLVIPLSVALLVGSLVAIVSAMLVAWGWGASWTSVLSLAPKSITTPIAMGVSEKIGGLPSLTAVLVIITGIFGATVCEPWLKWLRIRDPAAQGFAIGMSAHGIGTARAFLISEEIGAFSALAMGLNGFLTALLVPFVIPWIRLILMP
jgi:predicted murein hydrolase (TIGR00659 family)